MNPTINLERLLKKTPKKGEYIATKYYNTPGDNESGSYEINLYYYRGGSPEMWLVWKDKLLKALYGQSISTRPQRYTFTKRLWTSDTKVTLHQVILDKGIPTVGNFEITKDTSPMYAFYKQKRCFHRHLIKSSSMKLHRVQKPREISA